MLKTLSEKFGPGFLFAAMAVGVSHLVQSSRAGADYGFSLAWVLLLACLIKYPAFRFAADYAAAVRDNLIDAYERQGRWVLAVMILVLPADMFIGSAAVALVSAGIVKSVFHLEANVILIASVLIMLCGTILILGKYRVFEMITKIFVVLFAISTLIAAGVAVPQLDWATAELTRTVTFDKITVLFMIAAAGWMPTAMTASLFQSLWVTAKQKSLGYTLTPKDVRLDFNIGYIFTIFLAMCFLFLGTVFLFNAGVPVSGSADGFAGQLIAFFTGTIGQWAYPIIASAAIAVMFSTLLTLVDACPRGYATIIRRLRNQTDEEYEIDSNRLYSWLIVTQVTGVILVLTIFFRSFSTFIDFAASLGFLVAPFIAWFNHRAIFSDAVPQHLRPGKAMWLVSLVCMAAMALIALSYLYFNFLAV